MCSRFTVSAAAALMILPVEVSPVSETRRTRGLRTSASPSTAPRPVTTLSTPGGRMSAASSARRSVLSGVIWAGLMIEVLPAAKAGPSFQMAIISG